MALVGNIINIDTFDIDVSTSNQQTTKVIKETSIENRVS